MRPTGGHMQRVPDPDESLSRLGLLRLGVRREPPDELLTTTLPVETVESPQATPPGLDVSGRGQVGSSLDGLLFLDQIATQGGLASRGHIGLRESNISLLPATRRLVSRVV
jgi:hypothetical protein